MPIGHDEDVIVPSSIDIYPEKSSILFLVQKPDHKMNLRERPLVRQILWKRYIVNKTDLQTFLERQFPDMSNFDINV